MLKQVGQIISTHIRQADVAVLYDTTTIALLLADTPEKGAFLAIDKLRRVLTDINLPGRDTPPVLSVGIAEAAMRAGFDPVDIVTEMINRVEAALVAASADPTNKVQALQPELETAAA
jgi:GGDEF domain-containing protein